MRKTTDNSVAENMAAMCCSVEEIEDAVVGALLLESGMTSRLLPMVREGMFYQERNRLVFQAIVSAYRKNRPVDILVVTEELKELGTLEEAGGPLAVAKLLGGISSSAHFQEHCLILHEYQVRRELARLMSQGLARSGDMTFDVFEVAAEVQETLGQLLDSSPLKSHLKPMEEVMDLTMERIGQRTAGGRDGMTGIPTGVELLDRVTGGWQPGNLILTAARPGVGKTQLDLHMALTAAKAGYRVLFFTLEMMDEEVGERLLLMDSDMDFRQVKKGLVSADGLEKLKGCAERMKPLALYVDDTPYISIDQLCGIARCQKAKRGVDLVVVDYLQLLNPTGRAGRTREQEVAECTRKLKALARSLECPVIVSSQLNRQADNTYGHRPGLNHLRESGAIEQDADIVVMLYRPDADPNGPCRLMVAKNRHGETVIP